MKVSTLKKSKDYCKCMKFCKHFKRSECDNKIIDTENCDRYKLNATPKNWAELWKKHKPKKK